MSSGKAPKPTSCLHTRFQEAGVGTCPRVSRHHVEVPAACLLRFSLSSAGLSIPPIPLLPGTVVARPCAVLEERLLVFSCASCVILLGGQARSSGVLGWASGARPWLCGRLSLRPTAARSAALCSHRFPRTPPGRGHLHLLPWELFIYNSSSPNVHFQSTWEGHGCRPALSPHWACPEPAGWEDFSSAPFLPLHCRPPAGRSTFHGCSCAPCEMAATGRVALMVAAVGRQEGNLLTFDSGTREATMSPGRQKPLHFSQHSAPLTGPPSQFP